jgi:hypothetical protein
MVNADDVDDWDTGEARPVVKALVMVNAVIAVVVVANTTTRARRETKDFIVCEHRFVDAMMG